MYVPALTLPAWRGPALAAVKLLVLLALLFGIAELVWLFQFWVVTSTGGSSAIGYNGDYFHEADWGLIQVAQGHIFSLYAQPPLPRQPPLMMPLSLLVRALSLAAAASAHIITLGGQAKEQMNSLGQSIITQHAADARYRWGAVTVLAVGAETIIVTLWYRAQRQDRVLGLVLCCVALVIPLAGTTIYWGHPEEFLMGTLIVCVILAASRGMWTWAAIAFGFAVATKQPAWLLIPTFPFLLPPERRCRGMIIAGAVSAIIILPFVLPNLATIIGNQTDQVGASAPLIGSSDNVWGIFRALGWGGLADYGRTLTILFAVILPLGAAWRNHWRLTVTQAAAIAVMVLLVRSALDPFNINYYEYPAAAALLALEAHVWRTNIHPFRSRHLLARLRPLPILAVVAGLLLWLVNSGPLFQWFDTLRLHSVVYSLAYVLVNVIIAGPLLLIIRNQSVSFDRVSICVYGGLALITISLLFAISVVDAQSSRDHAQVPPPPGMLAKTPVAVAQEVYPERAYWLGSTDLFGGKYLRTSAVEAHKGEAFLAFFDYGASSTSTSTVAVFTLKGTIPKNLHHEIAECAHVNRICQRNRAHDLVTPWGIALTTGATADGTKWVVSIPRGDETISIISTAKISMIAVLKRLQLVSPSTTLSSG